MSSCTAIDAVLFDLDGTLADTALDLVAAVNHVLSQHGHAPADADKLRPMVSHGAFGMLGRALDLPRDDPGLQALLPPFLEHYRANLTVHTGLFPGIDTVLAALESSGRKWGIVTNKRASLTEPLVAELGLRERAGCVVSGDTTAHSKPHPEPLLHASALIGVAPDRCLFVGDAAKDIEAGRRAGMCTAAVTFGYHDEHDDPGAWGAAHVIDHALELIELISA